MENSNFYRFLIVIAVMFSGNLPAEAATINSASCAKSHIQAAIDLSKTGDIVTVPAGSCTWSSALTIPEGKRITLQGNGVGNTNINMSTAGYVLWVGKTGSRVTGISFIDGIISADGYDFRIDHCSFTHATWGNSVDISDRNTPNPIVSTGVIDHNTFTNGRIAVAGTNCMFTGSCAAAQHKMWANPLNLGSAEAVYVEDNTFGCSATCINVIDENYSGRYVFRYNTVDRQYIETHSIQGSNRGSRKWEIYGNILNNTVSSIYYPFRIRGGTGTVFYNSVIGTWTNYGIALDNVRSIANNYPVGDNTTGAGRCDGDNTWDGNEDGTGYPCRDQIGRGGDATLWTHSPPGPYTQTLVPAYGWLNRTVTNAEVPFVVINPNSGDRIKANRDFYNYNASFNGSSGMGCGTLVARPASCKTGVGYWVTTQSCSLITGMTGPNPSTPISGTLYKCTAPDTWTKYYTPYIYPHPLSRPGSPQNLRMAK